MLPWKTTGHADLYIVDVCCRVKKNHRTYVHESFKTGGGPPPEPVKEDGLAVAAGALTAELAFAEDQFDSLDPVVVSEETVGMYYLSLVLYMSIEKIVLYNHNYLKRKHLARFSLIYVPNNRMR